MIPALVVAGVASGVGKTTFTLGLLEALRRRGLTVQPFGDALMSYVHLHFGSNPAVADHLVRHVGARRGRREELGHG